MGAINIVDKVKITNGTTDVVVDSITAALNVITSEHKKIHDGDGFTYNADFILGPLEKIDILLVNPAGSYPHFRFYAVEASGAPGEVCLYKDTITSADGNLQSTYNNNLNSSNTPDMQVYLNSTITDDGEEIDCDILTGQKFEGGNVKPFVTEWILKPDTKYLIRYENNADIAIDVNVHLFHYK